MQRVARRLAHRGPNASLSSLTHSIRSCATESTTLKKSPSKVLHLRNLPYSVGENDLRTLVRPFGSLDGVLHLKEQALLQMETVEQATNVVEHFSSERARLGNKNIFIQYSSHQELTRPPHQDHGNVLFVLVHNPLYEINVFVLHRVFSPYGDVRKIRICKRSGVQGLIQFRSEEAAAKAKKDLSGREIFDGCCKLDIWFSKHKDIPVRRNNDFARNFANKNVPSETEHSSSLLGAGTVLPDEVTFHPSGVNTGFNHRRMLLVSNLNPEKIDEDKLFKFFSPYGKVLKVKLLWERDKALLQMSDGFQAELAINYLRGASLFGKPMEVTLSKLGVVSHPNTRDYTDHPNNRFQVDFSKNCWAPNKFLHAGNLPPDLEAEKLIEFMAPHSVLNVKLFDALAKDSRKQGLVEFQSIEDATDALVSKQFSSLGGLPIRLAFSKTKNINDI